MKEIDPIGAGLALSTLAVGWHLCWIFLVMLGWAQPFMNFIMWMYFIRPPYVIDSFNASTAFILVATTAIMAFSIGYAFSLIWNRLNLSQSP